LGTFFLQGRIRAYLRALGATDQGEILVHNIHAAIVCGRLDRADILSILQHVAKVWNPKASRTRWSGIDSDAVQTMIDEIVANRSVWRFKGKALAETDVPIGFLLTLDKLFESTANLVDSVKIGTAGIGKRTSVSPSLARLIADRVTGGAWRTKGAKLGQSYGIFWVTQMPELERLNHQPDGPARAAEACGLGHFASRQNILFVIASRVSLGDLARQESITPKSPTFIEGLNNFRFLGYDCAGSCDTWGIALDLKCLRGSVARLTLSDIVGLPEAALPMVPFDDRFELRYFGPVDDMTWGTDRTYKSVLDKFFGVVNPRELTA
jgi:hypothetical protein